MLRNIFNIILLQRSFHGIEWSLCTSLQCESIFWKSRTFRFCWKAWFVEFTLTLQIDSSILDWIINYNQSIMPRKKSVTPKLVLLDIQKWFKGFFGSIWLINLLFVTLHYANTSSDLYTYKCLYPLWFNYEPSTVIWCVCNSISVM